MALARLKETDNVTGLARELGTTRIQLYRWKRQVGAGGEAALDPAGRRARSRKVRQPIGPSQRIAELERTIGRQQVELDFFRAALQQVRAPRRRNGGPGDPTSTR